jgi:hypothetical protein
LSAVFLVLAGLQTCAQRLGGGNCISSTQGGCLIGDSCKYKTVKGCFPKGKNHQTVSISYEERYALLKNGHKIAMPAKNQIFSVELNPGFPLHGEPYHLRITVCTTAGA